LSDFSIFKLAAHYWGCADLLREWSCPEAVFEILKNLSAGQPCDITGIRDYNHLDQAGGIQWPLPDRPLSQPLSRERRLFEDGHFFTPDGRARFIFERPRPVPEPVDAAYPFTLLTGRGTSAQWHTNTRTGKSRVLRQLYPKHVYVEINPLDARRLRITPNQKVEIISRRASIVATALVTSTIQSGQVFIPMHYETVNQLTLAAFDPYSRQPAYKACAVAVRSLASLRGGRREQR